MPDRFIETHIRRLPLFAPIPETFMPILMEAFSVLSLQEGDFVFTQGEPTRGMYMFVRGRGQLIETRQDGRRYQIGIVGPNQYLNEGALFRQTQESASLRIVEDSVVLFLSTSKLVAVVRQNPVLREYLPVPIDGTADRRKPRVFQGQREHEEVLLDTRRHWWVLFRNMWIPGVLAVLLLGTATVVASDGVALALMALGLVLPGIIAVYVYLEWYNDHLVITNQRVIHIERVILLFQTRISETPLPSIQQVNAHFFTANPFSRILDFGRVELRNAGDAGNMTLNTFPNPEGIQNMIFEHRNIFWDREDREHRDKILEDVHRRLRGGTEMNVPEPSEMDKIENERHRSTQERAVSGWSTSYINAHGETVYRKHFTYWLRGTILPMMWSGGALLFLLATFTVPGLREVGIVGPVFGFFLLIIGALWFYWADWDWRNDMYIVGTDTIRLIHRRPLWLQNEEDRILLASVDNVQSHRNGVLQAMLDYGDVVIALIGGDKGDQKIFKAVPRPQQVQADITYRQKMLRRRTREQEEERRRSEIAEYLSAYHESVSGQNPEQFDTMSNPVASQQDVQSPQPTQPPRDRMRPPHIPRPRSE